MDIGKKQKPMPFAKPKENCKKCYGRGYIGFNRDTEEVVWCTCMIKAMAKAQEKINKTKKEVKEKLESMEKD